MVRERRVVKYSEAFRRRVVEELERGEMGSIAEAQRRYGIGGAMTIQGWMRRLGKNHLLAKVVRVEHPGEQREVERLRAQVRELEHALAQTHMRELLNEAFFEIVCEEHGITDLEAHKKKVAAELSRRREQGRGRSARRGG